MMQRYKVELPDKRIMTIEAPDPETAQRDADDWFAKNSGPQTSMLGSIARGLGQAAFGLGDEIEAGVRAAIDPNKTYADVIPEVRQKLAQSQEEYPIATYGAEIAGSVALPFGLASKGIGLTANAAQKGLGAAMKAGAAEGALYGAAYGAGKSEDGALNRAEGALGGATVGGLVGGAAPAVVAGAGAAADTIRSNVRAFTNPTEEATRRVAKTLIASDDVAREMKQLGVKPLRIDADPEAQRLIRSGQAGQDVMLVDTGGESARRLLRSAANNSPEAQEIANAALMTRSQGQTSRALDFIRGMTGRAGNAGQVGDDLARMRKMTTSPMYQAALQEGDRPIWSRNLEALTGSDMVKSAMQKAAQTVNNRSIAEGGGAMNVGVNFENGVMRFTRGEGGRTTYPNLQFWDEVKKNLDDVVGQAKRSGAQNEAATGTKIVERLREELDEIVPAYKKARGVSANYFKANDALEAGQVFAKGRYDFNEVEKALKGMQPAERSMFEEGFVSGYLDKIAGTRDGRDLTKILMSDDNARRAFEVALGKPKARQLEAFLHIEKVMEASKNALGNSTTARQLREMGAAGVLTGAGSGVLQGGMFDPQAALLGAFAKWGASKGKDAIDNKMAVRMVQMLTSKDPKEFALAIQQAATPDNLAMLRRISAGITGAGANIGANVAAQGEAR